VNLLLVFVIVLFFFKQHAFLLDSNGKISFEEFIRLTMLLEGFKSSYETIDHERKGVVSTKLLGQWLLDLGKECTGAPITFSSDE